MKTLKEIIQALIALDEEQSRTAEAVPRGDTTAKVEYLDDRLDYHSVLLDRPDTEYGGMGFSLLTDVSPTGLRKTVVAVYGLRRSHKLQDLRITIGGEKVLEYKGRWVLVHGGMVCAESTPEGYWESFPDALKYPQWWKERVATTSTNPTTVGPYTLSSVDRDGNAPGADFGVSAYGHQWFGFSAGYSLMHSVAMQCAQRSHVFHGTESHPEGWWMTYDKPVGFAVDSSWWREFPIYHRYKTYDDQHSPRGWRAAAILAEMGDSFGRFVIRWWYMRMAEQWHDPTRKPMQNHLLMTIEQVVQATEIHGGSRALGRSGCWSARLALYAFDLGLDYGRLAEKFRLAFIKAAHKVSGEVSWNQDNDGYSAEERAAFEPQAKIGKMHEVGIYRSVAVDFGIHTTKVDRILRFPRGGIKEFGEPHWFGPVYPYLELAVGDFRNYEDFPLTCSTRSVLGSDQPLLATPHDEYPSL